MAELQLNDMMKYVGFTNAQARRLQAMAPKVAPHLPKIVNYFYDALQKEAGARAVLGEDPARIDRLRRTLGQWLIELFEGPYDDAYYERRARIGRAHVHVGLDQHYMFMGMSIIRTRLARLVSRLAGSDSSAVTEALHKLLDLELAIMLDTYREELLAKVREAERERMAARLDEARHLASVGQLAANLAHEIKNPLAGISGAIQVILHGTARDHPHRPVLDEVLAQIDRLDRAVKDTLVYARPNPPERACHRLDEVVDRVLYFLREEPAFRGVRVKTEGLDNNVMAALDEAQFQQVLSNLLLNAAHASPAGGVIRIRVKDESVTLRVEVSDSGHGMPPEVLTRAFEPFYTTKAKGTGLGLPICKHIIEAHGGKVAIQSRQGAGTTVRIELPKPLAVEPARPSRMRYGGMP